MQTRTLGNSRVQVSTVGLGCNSLGGRIDFEASRKVVYKALDEGITLFDTANSYGNRYGTAGGSEICLGKLLGARRKDIVLTTKFGTQSNKHPSIPVEGSSRQAIMAAVEASLTRLQTDWIDLYQQHHPDPKTPIEETLRAFDDLVRQGKVRQVGCSNIPPWRLADAQWTARHLGSTGFVTCQAEYSLLARAPERELLPALQHYGVGLLPYYPLAGGMLTGKYKRNDIPADGRLAKEKRLGNKYLSGENFTLVERLERYCAGKNRSLLELAFGWLLAHESVSSVIAGATKPEQVEANAKAAAWVLSATEMAEIEKVIRGEELAAAA